MKAWKEMDGKFLWLNFYRVTWIDFYWTTGKYVGNRPIKLKKADNNIRPVEIGHKKAKQLEKELKKNRHKPY